MIGTNYTERIVDGMVNREDITDPSVHECLWCGSRYPCDGLSRFCSMLCMRLNDLFWQEDLEAWQEYMRHVSYSEMPEDVRQRWKRDVKRLSVIRLHGLKREWLVMQQ